MKILVTGGLGAVGAPLVDSLRKKGNEVWVADLPHHHGLNGKYYFRCNIGHYQQLVRIFENNQFDFVYNLAGEFGRMNGEDFYESLWMTNAIGTKNIIRFQEKYGFKLIHFSSSEVYGNYHGLMSEDALDKFPIRQMNDYAISKWVNEMQIGNSRATEGTQSVCVRLFNTYGPGEPYSDYRSVICLFIYGAVHNMPYTVYLNHHRTFTYIDDCVQALSNICSNFKDGEVYNIASTSYQDIKNVSDLILKHLAKSDSIVTYKEIEKHNTLDKQTDNRKAVRDLNLKETVDLSEGLKRTIAWFKDYYSIA